MPEQRYLIVTADDYGVGPETSRGILDLAAQGLLTGTVMLANSPHAEAAVAAWRRAGCPLELGWHPCLTIDRPVLPPRRVPSLVDADGRFLRLGGFLKRLCLGRVRAGEIEAEFGAQYDRFRELVGRPPAVVNAHHHVHVFGRVGAALRAVLAVQKPLPYLRRVCETAGMLRQVPGARAKRFLLNCFGRRGARRDEAEGFPGNDWLAGITDPPQLDDGFFCRWLRRTPGRFVELTCHPGYLDGTLDGRDGSLTDGQVHRRPRELQLLRLLSFRQAVAEAGFRLVAPSQVAALRKQGEPTRLGGAA